MLAEVFQGYGKKTLVTGWHYPDGVPKDYDAYNPPFGNQFISTFKRLGNYEPQKLLSESKSTQRKALKKHNVACKKPLVNMVSYSTTLGDVRTKFWKELYISLLPDSFDAINYQSISRTDFINFNPELLKVKKQAQIHKPETKFRRLMVDGNDPRRPGMNTFYDDNQEYLNTQKRTRDLPPYGLCYIPEPY